MTPLEIEVLLHCHTCPTPHPRANAPAVVEALNWFEFERIIEPHEDYYYTTSRGKALVAVLRSVPLPQQQWVDQYGKVIKTT